MKQFIPSVQDGHGAVLVPEEVHYLLRVRRLKDGDEVVCLSPEGLAWKGRLHTGEAAVRIERIGEAGHRADFDIPPIHLVQGLPKGRKLDDIIRQACELGVSEIHLWQSDFSIPKFDEKWESKEKRFAAILKEAAQQSGNPAIPRLHPPARLDVILDRLTAVKGCGIVFFEKNLAEGSLHRYLCEPVSSVFAFIGPEGGISSDEIGELKRHGCFVATLGNTIMRTETAGIAAVAAIVSILQDRGEWNLIK